MECEIVTIVDNESFESTRAAMQEQAYWIRFFMRPCCPAPGEDTARHQVERLKADIDAREDMTCDQREELKRIAEERLNWYLALSVRHTA